MNLHKTTLMMIFWLLCQQAGAVVVSVLPSQNERGFVVKAQASCHEKGSSTNNIRSATTAEPHHHGAAIEYDAPAFKLGFKCCDIDCRCCLGGCASMLLRESSQALVSLSFQPSNLSELAFPQTPVHTLFRPPIAS
ncbi:hypothetical protein O0V09_16440 [Dasania sp. GY-19]|uniref:Uncharacterized protein n=1 Tax=Dasania phycosphaerae TaxID=2950436 RepID=A0A9J6RR12_9GAMM|nr:hypothetical protein [Dasania phycosphaerae]MCZ0866802.1 hypothetical protein [Dasania phycosphaerae]|tara:strand:- start:2670 stop:3077 length:408 start_codon:yes stop_codon:yes gene_type:complete